MDEQYGLAGTDTVKEKRPLDIGRVVMEVTYVAASAVLGRAEIAFGAMPFGFAALSATGTHAVSVFLGLCISLIGRDMPLIYAAAYALTLLIRSVASVVTDSKRQLLSEHISLRVVACSTGAFCVGLYRLLAGGFLYYDLFGAIISITACAIAAVLLHSLEMPHSGIIYRAVGSAVLLGALTWGLGGVGVYGVSASAFLALFSSLWVARKKGLAQGMMISLVTGLCVSVSYAPLFTFATVVYFLLSAVTPFFGASCALGVGLAWGIYIDGISALSSLLPALLAAIFTFLSVDRLYFTPKCKTDKKTADVSATVTVTVLNDISMARFNDTASRIKRLCEGFSSLSDTLIKTDVVQEQELLAYEIGELGIESDEEQGAAYCGGYMADSYRSSALAAQLGAVSDYLAGIMVDNEQSFACDTSLGERIQKELSVMLDGTGFAVTVFGEAKKRIIIYSRDRVMLERKREDIRRRVSSVCGFCIDRGEISEERDSVWLTFERASVLKATFSGKRRSSTHEKEFCGDSIGTVSDNGRFFAFISDGMGSGREAAATSALCSDFLQKLLPVCDLNNDCVCATVGALNGFICTRNGVGGRECTATVDLAALDTVACRATFYKSGAAPTYIFRDGSLFKVHSRTMPIGIMREVDIGKVSMELLPGDVIVMVSDGVTQGNEECPQLFSLLSTRIMTHDADQLADAVIGYANEQGATDDVSVVVIKISESDELFLPTSTVL